MSGFGNFGIGLGAAMQTFQQGIQIGRQIKGLNQEREVEKVTKEGMAEAQQARSGQIQGMIQTEPLPGGAESYKVGNRTFTNRAEAEREAGQHVGSVLDHFNKNIAPRIRDTYIGQGNMQLAEQWDKYTQSQETKRGMTAYAKALRSHSMGDDEGALKHMVEAYNDSSYYGDGYKIKGYEPIKDDKGKVIGYQGKFEGPDGKETTQDFRKGDLSALVQMGIGMLSPEQAFSTTMAQQQAADKARIESANKRAENDQKFQQDVSLDNNRSRNRITEAQAGYGYDSQLQAQRDEAADNRQITGIQMNTAADAQKAGGRVSSEASALRGLGASEEEARGAAIRSVGGGGAAKETDAGTAAWDAEQRNNPIFSNLTDDERQAAVIRGITGRKAASAAAADSGGANAGTIPAQAGGGIEVIDPATGKKQIIR